MKRKALDILMLYLTDDVMGVIKQLHTRFEHRAESIIIQDKSRWGWPGSRVLLYVVLKTGVTLAYEIGHYKTFTEYNFLGKKLHHVFNAEPCAEYISRTGNLSKAKRLAALRSLTRRENILKKDLQFFK